MGTIKIPRNIIDLMKDSEKGVPRMKNPPPPPPPPKGRMLGDKPQYKKAADENIIANIKARLSYLKQTSHSYEEVTRGNIHFKYWKNQLGFDMLMERSDGDGYINLINSKGKLFGGVFINADSPDTLGTIEGYNFDYWIKYWLEENPSNMRQCWYNRKPRKNQASKSFLKIWNRCSLLVCVGIAVYIIYDKREMTVEDFVSSYWLLYLLFIASILLLAKISR